MIARRMKGRHGWWLAVLALSQLASAATPEETVKAYMTAFQQQGLEATVTYFHPDELARFKRMMLPVFHAGQKEATQSTLDVFFDKGTTIKQLDEMEPQAFMAAFLKFAARSIKDVSFDAVEVLGTVPEGDLRHVVTRISVSGPKGIRLSNMEVITAKQFGSDWKLALTGELEGMAAALNSPH